MSKAVLVIDLPDSCSKCPLFNNVYSDMCCNGLNNRGINYPYPESFRQDWCPLKPVPEKYNIGEEIKKPHDIDYDFEYESGYNACIDEILGGRSE